MRVFLRVAALSVSLAACSDPQTAAERLVAADEAARRGDIAAAVALYDAVAADPDAGDMERMKAGMEGLVGRIALGRTADAIARFEAMQRADATGKLDYKATLRVLDTLAAQRVDPAMYVGLLELAGERHPEQKERLKVYVQGLIEKTSSDETRRKLKELPYLNG